MKMAVCTALLRSCKKLNYGGSWQRLQQLFTRNYAKKASAAAAGLSIQPKRKKLPVETDPGKLVRFCCGSNILKEGEDVELGGRRSVSVLAVGASAERTATSVGDGPRDASVLGVPAPTSAAEPEQVAEQCPPK
ncbi:hypothetical protein MRX96_010590 [Rhipicephalus microplus]